MKMAQFFKRRLDSEAGGGDVQSRGKDTNSEPKRTGNGRSLNGRFKTKQWTL